MLWEHFRSVVGALWEHFGSKCVLTCCRKRICVRIIAAMRILRLFGAVVAHVVTSDQEDAILTRKLGAIERINSDLEVRVGEGIISMGESFE